MLNMTSNHFKSPLCLRRSQS